MKKSRIVLALMIIIALVFTQASTVFAATAGSVKAPTLKTAVYNESSGTVTVKWSKVSGASGYQIYRAESKNGSYTKLADVKSSKTSYTDKKIKADRTYYYKLRAYKTVSGKKSYSKFSAKKSVDIWAKTESLDFGRLLKEASAEHEKQQTNQASFDGFTDYLVSGSEYKNLLTSSEINQLTNLDGDTPNKITYEKAAADVELLFRTLKYSYGAYFYFGGEERFDKAEKQVIKAISGSKSVDTEKLKKELKKALKFVKDSHFNLGESSIDDSSVRYEYFYSDIQLSKDGKGYYKELNGKKWYYSSCTNKAVKIKPTLTSEGEIVYSPLLFCPKTEKAASDKLTLKSGSQKKTITIKWKEQQALKDSSRTQDFAFKESDGVSYISIRCFDINLDQNVFNKYISTAGEVKDSKLIIYDLRANGGGSDEYARNWVENYAGTSPQLNSAFSTRLSGLLGNAWLGNEGYDYKLQDGNFLRNEVPIIVLTDDMCASAGESALSFLKTMDNVIVVGSNSAGYQLCGNISEYRLPNSGIRFAIPVSLQFKYDMKNVDGIGYEPDIWCNPKDALEAVYKLIENEKYASTDSISKLKKQVDAATPKTVSLVWVKFKIQAGENFGVFQYGDEITVFCDGKKTSDYKVVFENSDAPEVVKNANGTFTLKSSKTARYKFHIEAGNTETPFGVECRAAK